jgi:hypothetical protein
MNTHSFSPNCGKKSRYNCQGAALGGESAIQCSFPSLTSVFETSVHPRHWKTIRSFGLKLRHFRGGLGTLLKSRVAGDLVRPMRIPERKPAKKKPASRPVLGWLICRSRSVSARAPIPSSAAAIVSTTPTAGPSTAAVVTRRAGVALGNIFPARPCLVLENDAAR